MHLKNLNDILIAITLKQLSGCHSLIGTSPFKLKVLKMCIERINLKVILRRFTFFIKEIQNKKHFVKRTFTDISSYLFIVLTKTTKDEQDYLQFSVQPEKEP